MGRPSPDCAADIRPTLQWGKVLDAILAEVILMHAWGSRDFVRVRSFVSHEFAIVHSPRGTASANTHRQPGLLTDAPGGRRATRLRVVMDPVEVNDRHRSRRSFRQPPRTIWRMPVSTLVT